MTLSTVSALMVRKRVARSKSRMRRARPTTLQAWRRSIKRWATATLWAQTPAFNGKGLSISRKSNGATALKPASATLWRVRRLRRG